VRCLSRARFAGGAADGCAADGCAAGALEGLRPSRIGGLEFSYGSVERNGESTLAAYQVGPAEFNSQAAAFERHFERAGRQGYYVLRSLDRDRAFECFIEWCHY
jgi:hypothetical protein